MVPLQQPPLHPFNVRVLDSGLKVIHHPIPSPVAVMDIWVGAGATVEPAEWAGMAHFLEHMIFKGTPQVGPGEFDRAIESQGGLTNAATSHDYAHFFAVSAVRRAADILPHLADLLANAAIPDDEFPREREVVLEELRQALDNPDWQGFQAVLDSAYADHPYGRPVLGSEATLLPRSPEEMRRFHACHYQPENMRAVVVGGLDLDDTLRLLDRAFARFPAPQDCPRAAAIAPPPEVSARRHALSLPRLEQARLTLAWHGPGSDRPLDLYALDAIAAVLTEGRSSRLVRELREEREWVQAISAHCMTQQTASLFVISAWLEPDCVEAVEALVLERVAELRDRPVPEREMARARRMLGNDYAFSTETPGQLAGLYGYYDSIGHLEEAIAYPQRIAALTGRDLRRAARRYLDPDRCTVVAVYPEDR